MLFQYCVMIKKVNINGCVLVQCNIDELKKEMNMNFGDWYFFRSIVLEMRNVESQVVFEDLCFFSESSSGLVLYGEFVCCIFYSELFYIEFFSQMFYIFNFSFEELNMFGLDEGVFCYSNLSWQL